jgi:uncharacterized repeat protein (TIGR01451 family)
MVLAGAGTAANGADVATSAWTVAKAKSYLRSIGVNPRTVVIQNGKRNYAGPHCPGKGWTCTKAKRVLQISATAITNTFTCKDATSGTDPGTNTCVVVQSNASAGNDARCFLTDIVKMESELGQTCRITQTNGTGKNFAWAAQDLRMYDSAAETGTQHVSITQTNRSGNNDALVTQNLIQGSVFSAATLEQVQEAHQDVGIDQQTDTGKNSSDVKQVLNLRASVDSGVGAISQSQDVADNGPNTLANIDQVSGSGANNSLLDQYNRLEAQATSNKGPVVQKQGSLTGGLHGDVHQESTGLSTTTSVQDEDQIAHATTPPGTLTQVQIGPLFCCGAGSSVGNSKNSVSITQTGHQESDGGSQTNIAEASCRSSGTCGTDQQKDNNVDKLTKRRSCKGSVESPCIIDQIVECLSEGCTTFTGEGEGAPGPTLEKGVRNVSRDQGNFTKNTPITSSGQTIEYQLTYVNNGSGTAHGVTLFDTPPSSFDFASCTGSCTFVGEAGTLQWLLGDVPAGGSRSVTFRGAVPCVDTSNVATAFSVENFQGITSNSATTNDNCID